jgi:hypothetical protein
MALLPASRPDFEPASAPSASQRSRVVSSSLERSTNCNGKPSARTLATGPSSWGKLAGLDRLTTGDLRLRRDGIVLLLFGIVLTTWPEWWAEHALGWLSWPLVAGLVVAYVAWRLCKAILVEIGAG